MVEPISGGMLALILAQAASAWASRTAQADSTKRSVESTERMQAESRALQRDLHASDQAFRERQQEIEHERAKERTAYAIQLQQEKDNHPLKGSFDKLELGLPVNVLRCFFAPPKFLTIGAPQNLLWEEMHPDRLEWEIMEFVQTYYGLDSDRPVQALGREVLNPKGSRGGTAVSLLYAMQPTRPTLWLQADRLDPGFCGLGVAIWGSGSSPRYRLLGTVPNYTLAHHRSMAAEVMLADQTRESQTPELIKDNRKLNDIEITRQAVSYLAVAYKMLLAACADTYFLVNSGISPQLPQLIQHKVFDLEDRYIQDATRVVLASYLASYGKLASTDPSLAPEIWLGMAEAVQPLGDKTTTGRMLLEAWAALARRYHKAKPETLADIGPVHGSLPQSAQHAFAARTTRLLEQLGCAGLQPSAPPDRPPGQGSKLSPDIQRLISNSDTYFS